jgi:predicted DNA binding CopG/RHH family protein
MNDLKLQPDELEVLASYENEEWQSMKTIKEQIAHYQAYARATFRKDKRVNIRISEKDLLNLQKTRHARRHPIPDLDLQCSAQICRRSVDREIANS